MVNRILCKCAFTERGQLVHKEILKFQRIGNIYLNVTYWRKHAHSYKEEINSLLRRK